MNPNTQQLTEQVQSLLFVVNLLTHELEKIPQMDRDVLDMAKRILCQSHTRRGIVKIGLNEGGDNGKNEL